MASACRHADPSATLSHTAASPRASGLAPRRPARRAPANSASACFGAPREPGALASDAGATRARDRAGGGGRAGAALPTARRPSSTPCGGGGRGRRRPPTPHRGPGRARRPPPRPRRGRHAGRRRRGGRARGVAAGRRPGRAADAGRRACAGQGRRRAGGGRRRPGSGRRRRALGALHRGRRGRGARVRPPRLRRGAHPRRPARRPLCRPPPPPAHQPRRRPRSGHLLGPGRARPRLRPPFHVRVCAPRPAPARRARPRPDRLPRRGAHRGVHAAVRRGPGAGGGVGRQGRPPPPAGRGRRALVDGHPRRVPRALVRRAAGAAHRVRGGAGDPEPGLFLAHPRTVSARAQHGHGGLQRRHLCRPRPVLCRRHRGRADGGGAGGGRGGGGGAGAASPSA